MSIVFDILKKKHLASPKTFEAVKAKAKKLQAIMEDAKTCKAIQLVHKRNGTSTQIQAILHPGVLELGFKSEKTDLLPGLGSRPDFFMAIGDSGILMEVERGRTTENNMDLLDFWKCHLCKEADYLFLVVPKERQGKRGTTKPYERVLSRLAHFFATGNEVNVEAVFLFGY